MKEKLLIGQLAEKMGITTQAIRYYERLGILEKPIRNEAGYRVYDNTALSRLQLIRGLQNFGLSLTQIQDLINLPQKKINLGVFFETMVSDYLEELEVQINSLEKQKQQLSKRHQLLIENLNKQEIIAEKDLSKLINEIETQLLVKTPKNTLKKGQELLALYMKGERNFRGIELIGVELNGAMLNEINLSHSQLMLASLNEICLEKANLKEAYVNGADLIGAYLVDANLLEAFFIGADLTEANLENANLVNCNLGGANLQNANLRGANLSEAIFIGADLRNADLRGAIILGTNFFDANLQGTFFDENVNLQGE